MQFLVIPNPYKRFFVNSLVEELSNLDIISQSQ